MSRAVQTLHSSLVHLFVDGGTFTRCGTTPSRNAPQVIHRLQMCCNCFGRDHGLSSWSAQQLGLDKIYEAKGPKL